MDGLWIALITAGSTLSGVTITEWFNRKERETQRRHDKEFLEQAREDDRTKERRQKVRDLYANCLALMREFHKLHGDVTQFRDEVVEWQRDESGKLHYKNPQDDGSARVEELAATLLHIDTRFDAILGELLLAASASVIEVAQDAAEDYFASSADLLNNMVPADEWEEVSEPFELPAAYRNTGQSYLAAA